MAIDTFSHDARRFILELDEAVQEHLEWTRRVLRCAVLRAPPGVDVMAPDASRRCRLQHWLQSHFVLLAELDAAAVGDLHANHERMHDAARCICERLLSDTAVNAADLDDFERTQAAVVAALARLRTAYMAHCTRLDALTGLPLRYGIEDEFNRCRAAARRHGELLVVMMLDLDEFKRVNDRYGHAAGDRALQHCASLLRSHCRAGEPLFRVGGEEFLALLQTADRAAAQLAAERILQALRDHPLQEPEGELLSLRASAGLAEVGDRETMIEALERADRALYAAKSAGRDTWRWAPASALG